MTTQYIRYPGTFSNANVLAALTSTSPILIGDALGQISVGYNGSSQPEIILNNTAVAQPSVIRNGLTSQSLRIGGSTTGLTGGSIELFGSTAGTPNITQFTNAATVSGSISAAQVWAIGASGGTATHTIRGSATVTATQAAQTNVAVNNISAAAGAEAAVKATTGDATTSTKYAYFQSRNRQTSEVDWYQGTLGDDNFSIARGTTDNAPASATKYFTIDSNGACVLTGVADASAAAAGKVGQRIVSAVQNQNAGTSGQYANLASISLTAGDYDVDGLTSVDANAAVITGASYNAAISINSGNTTTDQVLGDNQVGGNLTSATSGLSRGVNISGYQINVSSTTTVYLKTQITYTGATPLVSGRISARRMR